MKDGAAHPHAIYKRWHSPAPCCTFVKTPHNETYESGPSGQGAGQSRRDANGEHVYGEFV